MDASSFVVAGVALALVFDFTNGYNDSASLVGSMVATRTMRPRPALWFAAFFEMLGPLVVGTAVATAIGGIIEPVPGGESAAVVTVALVGAIAWNALAAMLGMPTSSSHALVGSLLGAQLMATGRLDAVNWGIASFDPLHPQGVVGVASALLVSPVVGFTAGLIMYRCTMRVLRGTSPGVVRDVRRLQVAAAAGLAFSHGSNDAQKTMGVITLLLVSSGHLEVFVVPTWVKLAAASAISLGVLVGGQRIMRTIGSGIFRMRPVHGLASQGASAAVILGSSLIGGPVSTAHVVSSTIMGVGAGSRSRAVRWGKVREILVSWVVTIPATALLAAILTALLRGVMGGGR